jgi:hypothetical protein
MRRFLLAIGLLLAGCTAPVTNGATTDDDTTMPETLETTTSASPESPTTATDDMTPDAVECPSVDQDRQETTAGPFFLCEIRSGEELTFGGQIVARPDVSTAEDAIRAWLEGPTEDEQAAGLQGWDLRPNSWFANSMSFRRDGTALVMELEEWEPIDNLSTSNGAVVFYLTLFGTAFSDPTVDHFDLVIRGENCPVMIGEPEWCFPIDWDDFIQALG